MLIYLKNAFLFLTLLCAVISFQSCDEEGCTDPNGENYNADADTDDGSCTYARTKFVGSYGAGESCDGGAATSSVVSITESATATNELTITNETLGVTITGVVSGDKFVVDDIFVQGGTDFNIVGEGTYSDVDGDEKINFDYTIMSTISGQVITQTCVGLWLKV